MTLFFTVHNGFQIRCLMPFIWKCDGRTMPLTPTPPQNVASINTKFFDKPVRTTWPQ